MYPYDSNPYQQSQNLIQNQLLQSISQTPSQTERHVTKVNGRAGADSFNMPPNSDDILLDLNNPLIYFVQTDGAGYKTITPYDISPHKEVQPEERYKALEDRIARLEERLNNGKPNNKPNEPRQHNDAGNRSNDKG